MIPCINCGIPVPDNALWELCVDCREGKTIHVVVTDETKDPKKITEKNLNKTVAEGRAHGKNINRLRSQFDKKTGAFKYKYLWVKN